MGDFDRAASVVEKISALEVDDAHCGIGRTLICMNDFDRAATVVEKISALELDDAHRAEISELATALNVR